MHQIALRHRSWGRILICDCVAGCLLVGVLMIRSERHSGYIQGNRVLKSRSDYCFVQRIIKPLFSWAAKFAASLNGVDS